ncbi:MAG: hypothetical protein ACRELG_07310 [Gemmataceae bacterium]
MIELTEEQRHNVLQGNAVRVVTPEFGIDCVLLRADVYERLRSVLEEDELDMRTVALLIEQNMREDDANDPLLESYQDPRSPA